MPKIRGVYSIQQRSKKNYLLTINNPESGLPPEMCQKWQRKSFSRLPAELSHFRYPTSRQSARNGADALVEFLKKEADMGNVWRFYTPVTIGS